MSHQDRGRLAELADLLCGCREIYLAVFLDGLTEPVSGSRAEYDFGSTESGSSEPWPPGVVQRPRALALKLLRQQADYCVALGTLIGAGEVFDPVSTSLRTLMEYGTRVVWVLDPSIEHRERCARAFLMELVSLHHLRAAMSGLATDAARNTGRQQWRRLKATARGLFDPVEIADDPASWRIEGVRYDQWTRIAERWAQLEGSGIDGGSLYQLLAVDGHPQGFVATRGLETGPTGVERVLNMQDLINRIQLAIACLYSALTLVANYHGYRSSIVTEWEEQIDRLLPGALSGGN